MPKKLTWAERLMEKLMGRSNRMTSLLKDIDKSQKRGIKNTPTKKKKKR